MNKKELVVILVLGMFCFSFVSASNLLTKIDFEISGFSGISNLDNSNGTDVVISIFNDSGVVVSRNATAGVYLENMTITMSGAKFNLSYSTQYTYNLSTIYGDFLYNFTTPEASGGLPSTGQTNSSYDGDDAFHDGTARDDFTADGNGTVSDSLTGLMWQDGESSSLNWTEAIDYCNGLNWGGFSGWRLPNYIEFVSVINFSTTSESNHWPSAFNTQNGDFYWTSTTVSTAPDSDYAYFVDMSYGGIYSGLKDDGYRARCVRDQ